LMERYWMLRWLVQHDVRELDATLIAEATVRADAVPLVFRVAGTEALPRGARVRVRITGVDELALDVHANLGAKLDDGRAPAAADTDADAASDDEAESVDAAPLALAIDVNDATDQAEAAPQDGSAARQS
jgi:exoribonuclease II